MEIKIKYTNIEPTPALESYIAAKISALEKFLEGSFEKGNGFGEPLVISIEVGKASRHHKKGKNWRAEFQIKLPRKTIRAVSENYTLKTAIDEAKMEMKHLLVERKEKLKEKRG